MGAHTACHTGHTTEDIGSLPPDLVSVRRDDHREEDAAAEAHLAQALGKWKHGPEYHNTTLYGIMQKLPLHGVILVQFLLP